MKSLIQSVAPFTHIIIAFALVFLAALSDYRKYKIPNRLTFPMLICGLAWHGLSPYGKGFELALTGMCVGFLTLFPFFAAGGMGAGDLKIMMALGALLGPLLVFFVFIASSIVCGLYVVVWACRTGRFMETVNRLACLLGGFLRPGKLVVSEAQVGPVVSNDSLASAEPIPFGIMVAAGMVLVFGMGVAFIML